MQATVYLPPGYAAGTRRYPVLYVNDGQDREAVHLQETLQRLIADGAIRAPIVVAIDMPRDRMGAYGLSDREHGTSVIATRYDASSDRTTVTARAVNRYLLTP